MKENEPKGPVVETEIPPSPFLSSQTRLLSQVLLGDIVKPAVVGEEGVVIADEDRLLQYITQCLDRLKSNFNEFPNPAILASIGGETIGVLAEKSSGNNNSFTQTGLIPEKLIQLTSQNLIASNIRSYQLSGQIESPVLSDSNSSMTDVLDNPDIIYLGKPRNTTRALTRLMSQYGLATPECLKIAYQMNYGHEYGHAITIALIRQMIKNDIRSHGKISEDDISEIVNSNRIKLFRNFYNSYPMPPDVVDAIKTIDKSNNALYEASLERIANSFGFAVLEILLKNKGFQDSVIFEIRENMLNKLFKGFFLEYIILEQLALKKNIHLKTLNAVISLDVPEDHPASNELISFLNSYSAAYLGYEYPLSFTDIRRWIISNSPLYRDFQPIRKDGKKI